MIWRVRRQEPSFSSIKEKSFESRRVRTQPCTKIASRAESLLSASLIRVASVIRGNLAVDCHSTRQKGIDDVSASSLPGEGSLAAELAAIPAGVLSTQHVFTAPPNRRRFVRDPGTLDFHGEGRK